MSCYLTDSLPKNMDGMFSFFQTFYNGRGTDQNFNILGDKIKITKYLIV